MPDQTISQMTQVEPTGSLLVPVVNMSAAVGLKNVTIPLSSFFAGGRVFVASGVPGMAANPGDLCTNPSGGVGERLFLSTNGAPDGWVALA